MNQPRASQSRLIIIAGFDGNRTLADKHTDDPDPVNRIAALGVLRRTGHLRSDHLRTAFSDPDPSMRIRGLRLAVEVDDPELDEAIRSSLDDPEPAVVETAAFVLGERLPASTASRERLESVATGHPNALCRESAIAALGSIGDEASFPTVAAGCSDVATVRRRAVLALVAFDDPQVDMLLETLTHDVDWQVRQAAEELLALGEPDQDESAVN